MYRSQELLSEIEQYLSNITNHRLPNTLYEPIRYVLAMGGKRIRPVLLLLTYNIYREDIEKALPAACGLETYHNYTLLHDDLMDNADLRRGNKTVHKCWNANTAILSGDSMLVLAYQHISKSEKIYLPRILDIFTTTALEIGEGQQYDMDFEQRNDVKEEEYIEMIRLKTSVLLACAMKIGAILAGASEEDADNFYKFGEEIGLAFQLQDDYLDVFGNVSVFGKTIGGDIICNKKTFMLINALNRANEEQYKKLNYWLSYKGVDVNEKITEVTSIYKEIGIDKIAEDKIKEYFRRSQKYLDVISVEQDKKSELIAFINDMMIREK